MNWLGHVARIGERIGACKVLVGNPRKIHHMEDLGVYGRIIVEWTLKGRLEECGLECSGS